MLEAQVATAEANEKSGLFHRVYLPEGRVEKPRPAVVLVHGRAGDARVMWVFSRALERIKPVVVSPQAPQPDPIGGYSWWQVQSPAESPAAVESEAELRAPVPSLETIEETLAPLERFVDSLPELYQVDPSQLYCAGFSQGGAMLASLALKRPTLFKGVAMLSSFIPRAVAEAARKPSDELPPFFVFHGSKDPVVSPRRANDTRRTLEALGAEVELVTDDVTHKVSTGGVRALEAWFNRLMLDSR